MNDDMLYAVTHKDLGEMERLLEGGWTPPRSRALHAGTYVDHSVWTEVIVTDWLEGFLLLDKHFPDETAHQDVFELILRNAAISCLRHVWGKFNMNSSNLSIAQKNLWVQALMGGMGEPWSAPHDIKNVMPVLQFLREHGVVLDMLYPGSFQYNDLRMNGHSLWTRAVSVKRWDLLDELWPQNGAWAHWPRLHEVVHHLISVVVGDYKPLLPENHGVLPEYTNLMRWLTEHGEEWVLSSSPLRYWSPSIQSLLGPVPEDDEGHLEVSVIDALAVPSSTRISAWLRLPLSLSDPNDRKLVWGIWERALEQDLEKTWLRQLALYPDDPDVTSLLSLISSDGVTSLQNAWREPTSSGMSVSQQWSAMSDQPDPFIGSFA